MCVCARALSKCFSNFICICSVIVHELEPTSDQSPEEGQLSPEVGEGRNLVPLNIYKLSPSDLSLTFHPFSLFCDPLRWQLTVDLCTHRSGQAGLFPWMSPVSVTSSLMTGGLSWRPSGCFIASRPLVFAFRSTIDLGGWGRNFWKN